MFPDEKGIETIHHAIESYPKNPGRKMFPDEKGQEIP